MTVTIYWIGSLAIICILVLMIVRDLKRLPYYINEYGEDGVDHDGTKIKILKIWFITFVMRASGNESKDK